MRIMPGEAALEVEVDVDWQATGSQIVVDSLVSISDKQWNMKLLGFELSLKGRMLFVLKLSKSVLPGIEGAHPDSRWCRRHGAFNRR